MNQPRGFTLRDGHVVHVDPAAAMLNPASPPQTVHMILAAFMVSSFLTTAVYAVALLQGRRDAYHKAGFALPFTVGAVVAPFQIVVGDWAARFLADYQPVKLAAIEGVYRTGSRRAGCDVAGTEPHGRMSTKSHLAADGHARPSAITVTAGEAGGAAAFVRHCLRRGRQDGRPRTFDADACKQRNTVERCINRLGQWRGLATRTDKLAISRQVARHLAAIFIRSAR
ncbi:hypothetical protein ADL04_26380 [Streptomyces sp. NRRL B-3648]|nr:hypothetical protein ADL04_26380 [Streptomyces sp. NRRL B-3648]